MGLLKPPAGSLLNLPLELQKSCVGWWEFNEGSGVSTVRDLSGYGNDGTLTNFDGQTLGPELVTNGDFATDSDWTKQAGWTIGGGTANCADTGNSISQNAGLVPGNSYQVTYTVSNYVSGNIRTVLCGSKSGTARTANGTYTEIITPTSGNASVFFNAQVVEFEGSIDDISIKQVTATSDWLPGPNGWTLDFDGNDDYVGISDSPSLNTDAVTISAWINVDTSKLQYILAKMEDFAAGGKVAYGLYIDADEKLVVVVSDDGDSSGVESTSSAVISLNTWVHVAATYAAGVFMCYVNGVQVATDGGGTATGAINQDTGRVTIAARYDSGDVAYKQFISGQVSHVSVFDKALTTNEVKWLYDNTAFGYDE
jgi:hypothetical protein